MQQNSTAVCLPVSAGKAVVYGLGLMRQFNGMLVTLRAFNGARWVAQLESGTSVNFKVENLFVPPPNSAEEAVPVVGTSDAADSDLPVFFVKEMPRIIPFS